MFELYKHSYNDHDKALAYIYHTYVFDKIIDNISYHNNINNYTINYVTNFGLANIIYYCNSSQRNANIHKYLDVQFDFVLI